MINREADYYLCVSLYPICFYYLVIIAADCSLGRPRGGKALASLDHFFVGLTRHGRLLLREPLSRVLLLLRHTKGRLGDKKRK